MKTGARSARTSRPTQWWWSQWRSRFAGGLVLGLSIGCGGASDDVIIKTAAGVELKAEDIDRDSIALLPSGPIGVARTDAQAQFRSAFGSRLLQIVQSRVPVPPAAGFVPERDLERLVFGIYSMQGVDFVAVATGRFDPQAIQSAADGSVATPLGAPLVKSNYGGRTLYVAGNIGFVVLTARTVLLGNETGMRRALDRIQSGRLQERIPPEMEQWLTTQTAPIAASIDLASRPEVAAAVSSVPATPGLATVMLAGNFEPPGMNVTARFAYQTAEQAVSGSETLLALRQRLQSFSLLTSWFGYGDPIHSLAVQTQGNVAHVNLSLNGTTAAQLIEQLASLLGAPTAPVRAQTSPGLSPR